MSDGSANRFVRALRRAGLRLTSQRLAICDFLARTPSHPTPYEIYAQVKQLHPSISLATVYNTLDVLRDLGEIAQLGLDGAHTAYETDPLPHVNLICQSCGQVEDVWADLQVMTSAVAEAAGYQWRAARLDIYGLCPRCQKELTQDETT